MASVNIPTLQASPIIPVTNSNRLYRVRVTFAPERYGQWFMDGQPDLFLYPVAFLYIRVFTSGNGVIYPAIPIQQQEVWFPQPVAEGKTAGGSANLVLMPGVQAIVSTINQ